MPRSTLVWVLLGDKAGDNAQLKRLARGLAESRAAKIEEKNLRYNAAWRLPNWLLGASYSTLSKGREQLTEPWPDLLIASGRRSAPVARAIKKESGGKTRLIHIGRPRAKLSAFDLVLTTPQYRLPPRENVMPLFLPLVGADRAATHDASIAWQDRLAAARSPRVALLVGGDSKPFRLDKKAAERLGDAAKALCEEMDASLLVTCGRRVRPESVEALRQTTAACCAHFHVFDGKAESNPYLAYLGSAEAFIVTSDSVSMMADAVMAQRPVFLFETPQAPTFAARCRRGLEALAGAVFPLSWREAFVARGLCVPQRRSEFVATSLIEEGYAARLGEAAATEKIIDESEVFMAIMRRVESTT